MSTQLQSLLTLAATQPRQYSMRRMADTALKSAAGFWFIVTVFGELIFAVEIASFYGLSALDGKWMRWNQTMTHGYVPGQPIGNIVVVIHLGAAVLILVSGALQLIPFFQRRAPRLHRWNGRLYMVTAFALSLAGLYMMWFRGTVGGLWQHLGQSLDAALIMVFAVLALRYALARDFKTHRRWALRLFLAVSASLFLRATVFLSFALNGGPFGIDPVTLSGPFLTFVTFAQYLVPLGILELYLRTQQHGGIRTRFAMAATLLVLSIGLGAGIATVTMASFVPALRKAYDSRQSIAEISASHHRNQWHRSGGAPIPRHQGSAGRLQSRRKRTQPAGLRFLAEKELRPGHSYLSTQRRDLSNVRQHLGQPGGRLHGQRQQSRGDRRLSQIPRAQSEERQRRKDAAEDKRSLTSILKPVLSNPRGGTMETVLVRRPEPISLSPSFAIWQDILAQAMTGELVAALNYTELAAICDNREERADALEHAAGEQGHAAAFAAECRKLGVPVTDNVEAKHWKRLRTAFMRCIAERDFIGCLIVQEIMLESFAVASYRRVGKVGPGSLGQVFTAIAVEEEGHIEHAMSILKAERARDPQRFDDKLHRLHLEVMTTLAEMLAKDCSTGHCEVCHGNCVKPALPHVSLSAAELRGASLQQYLRTLDTLGLPGEVTLTWVSKLPV